MKRIVRYNVIMLVWGTLATASQAQFGPNVGGPGAVARPAVSPYLNLLRGGDPAINYYGLVRPQIAAAKAFDTLGNEFKTLDQNANLPLQTGHVSSFQTQGRYFLTNGAPRSIGQPGTAPKRTGP